jgi:hypothetical protein
MFAAGQQRTTAVLQQSARIFFWRKKVIDKSASRSSQEQGERGLIGGLATQHPELS